MDATKMLQTLSEQGEDPDFNDGLDGYFGWKITTDGATPTLVITFEDTSVEGVGDTYYASWTLERST